MGYSTSKITLEKIRPRLASLEEGHGGSIEVLEGEKVGDLAYKIREALFIAEMYPQDYPVLSKARQHFKVQIVSPSAVSVVLLNHGATSIIAGTTGSQGLAVAGKPHKVMGKQTAGSIIEYILGAQQRVPSNSPFQWPEAELTVEDATRVSNWCHKQTPPWLFIMAEGRVTITRKTRDMTEDLEWSVEDGE